MAQLTFTKQGDLYVAEFEATADFNLHIERGTRKLFSIARKKNARTSSNGQP